MIVEVSVVPIGTGETSVSAYVRAAVQLIEEIDLDDQVNSMGTCLQGDTHRLFFYIRAVRLSRRSV